MPSISKNVPWRAVMPTFSMSPVRMHFWQVQTRCLGGSSSPVKYFFIGAIPEFMSSRERSFTGMSEKLLRRRCPFDSKNERNASLRSLSEVHFMINTSFSEYLNAPRRTITNSARQYRYACALRLLYRRFPLMSTSFQRLYTSLLDRRQLMV